MPKIERISAGPTQVARPVGPVQFGASEGQALQQLGGAIQEVAEVGARAYDGYQRQLARSRAAEVDESLRRYQEELGHSKPFQEREQLFENKYKDLTQELSDGLSPGRQADFRSSVEQSYARYGAVLRQDVYQDTYEAAGLELSKTLRLKAQAAATADNEFDRYVAIQEGSLAIREFARQFGQSDAVLADQLEHFRKNSLDGEYLYLLRTSPSEAIKGLQIPNEGLAYGRTEPERQKMLEQASAELIQQTNQLYSLRQKKRADEDYHRKTLAGDAQRGFIEKAQGDGLSVDDINAYSEILEPEDLKEWLQWTLDTGGVIKRQKLDTEEYSRLRAQAAAGEDVEGLVLSAQREGRLGKTEADQLRKLSEDSRFGPAEDYLASALRVGELAHNPFLRQRNSRAKLFFDRWRLENPDATAAEADRRAQIEVDRAMVASTEESPVSQTPPLFAVMIDKDTLDSDATKDGLAAAYVRGELSDPEYERELDLVDALVKAQEARKRKREAADVE